MKRLLYVLEKTILRYDSSSWIFLSDKRLAQRSSVSNRTLQTVDRIQREHQVTAMAHLTCVNRTGSQPSADILEGNAPVSGSENILCTLRRHNSHLKGHTEPVAQGSEVFDAPYESDRFHLLDGLIFNRRRRGLPEGDTACIEGREADWERLQKKIDCGARLRDQ